MSKPETLRFGLLYHEVHKLAIATSHCDLVATITPRVAARPALHFWTLDPGLVVPLSTMSHSFWAPQIRQTEVAETEG